MSEPYLTVRLRAMVNSKHPAYAKLAAYILANPQKTTQASVTPLAEAAEVSYATVCRFTKSLGFYSFGELRRSIADTEDISPILPESDVPPETEFDTVISSVCNLSKMIVESCRSILDASMLENISRILRNAGNIYFIGLGTSAVTAHYACIKFFRLRLPCTYDADTIIMRMKTSLLKKGDLLFAISSSGRTKNIIESAKLARNNGVSVISLCDYKNSPLSRCSDICITTSSRDSSVNSNMDLPLIQGQLTVIDILYSQLFGQMGGYSFERTKDSVRNEKMNFDKDL